MHTKIFSATTIGVHAHQVDVEVDLAFGLIDFLIVGLPDTAIKESKQRVVTALKNSGFKSPEKKIILLIFNALAFLDFNKAPTV